MSLTTVVNVKAWLEISSSASDLILERLIKSCSASICNWLDRNIELQNYSEQYNGSGSNRLSLRNYPIKQIDSITVNGLAKNVVLNTDLVTPGVRFEGRRIIINGGIFSCGSANISISYSAGFEVVPDDLEQACIELVSMAWKNKRGDRLGVTGKSLAGESISFFTGDMPASVKTVLQQYKNVVPV